MKNRPSGLVYRRAGRKVKIMTGRPGRPAIGEVVTNYYEGHGATRPTLCRVVTRIGEMMVLPSDRIKVIA